MGNIPATMTDQTEGKKLLQIRLLTPIKYLLLEDIKSLYCFVIYSLMFMISLQPHGLEPATQTSFAVMMADASPHPGSVMVTMTVAT